MYVFENEIEILYERVKHHPSFFQLVHAFAICESNSKSIHNVLICIEKKEYYVVNIISKKNKYKGLKYYEKLCYRSS